MTSESATGSACSATQFGRYRVTREIGRGAMGVVYLATDPVIERPVALKTISLPSDLNELQAAECFDRFAREAKAAGVLSHPGIVTVYDAGRDDSSGLCYLVMEYVPGRTLKREIEERGGLPEERVVELARRIAEALGHAHGRGIVHRDLKPANILLGEDGSVKITDFGIARMEASDLTREGQSIGSPAYMSPEQARGRVADRRSDLFSFGVVLYEMLTGRKPFAGADSTALLYQIVHEVPVPLRAWNPRVSPTWERIVARLMAKRPQERYADARGVLAELGALAGDRTRSAPRMGREDPDATLAEAKPPQASPTGRSSVAAPRPLPRLRKALEVARRRATGWIPHVRSPLGRSLALPALSKAAVFIAGSSTLILITAALGMWAAASCPVDVELKHGLEAGRLQIDVDGKSVVNRRFEGEQRGARVFGTDLFKRTGGTVEESFVVPPGAHEVFVRVQADGEPGDWSQTVNRTFEKGEAVLLQIRVATAFSKGGLRLDWQTAWRDAAE